MVFAGSENEITQQKSKKGLVNDQPLLFALCADQ